MGIPIGELQDRVSSIEFAEYWAYHQLEPFGPERDDLRAGIVASTIANVNRDPKKQPRAFTADQFIPTFAPAEEAADPEEDEEPDESALAEHHAKINALMLSFGGHPAGPETPLP